MVFEEEGHNPMPAGRHNGRAALWILTLPIVGLLTCARTVDHRSDLLYLNTGFENASPLHWQTEAGNLVHVYLVYDQERSSPNQAMGHWFFQVQAKPNAEITFILHSFKEVWNGKEGWPLSERTLCFVSEDGKVWHTVPTERVRDNCLRFKVKEPAGSYYLARLEPYRLAELESLKQRLTGNPNVEIAIIGKTVEGRDLEIIRIGSPDAPGRVFLRARAHPWEAGGNWVVEGVVERLLRGDDEARRYLDRYCVYILPLANKDGVVRGRTRFNVLGADLNRQWDQPADPAISPENHALESWLRSMIAQGQTPHLVIDLHNDENGKLHIARPNANSDHYLKSMERLEAVLRRYTWFTEGGTAANVRNPGGIGEGLFERFGIHACLLELNANWIAGLNAPPSADRWKLFGTQLCEAFFHYFDAPE